MASLHWAALRYCRITERLIETNDSNNGTLSPQAGFVVGLISVAAAAAAAAAARRTSHHADPSKEAAEVPPIFLFFFLSGQCGILLRAVRTSACAALANQRDICKYV